METALLIGGLICLLIWGFLRLADAIATQAEKGAKAPKVRRLIL